MKALDPAVLGDVEHLRTFSGAELRDLGRLPYPMVRRPGDKGFSRVSWDEALDLIADRIQRNDPDAFALYLTARGITNEVYYVAQKMTRVIGTNNVDNAAARLPLPVDDRAEAHDRRGRHHVLVHRRHR